MIRALLLLTFVLILQKALTVATENGFFADPVRFAVLLCIALIGLVGIAKTLK